MTHHAVRAMTLEEGPEQHTVSTVTRQSTQSRPWRVACDAAGDLFVSSMDGGVWKVTRETGKLRTNSCSSLVAG